MEETHRVEMQRKEMEIHFLRCTLAKTNQLHLDDIDSLMSEKPVKGWVPFSQLRKVSQMSSEDVEGEISVRGGKNLVFAWETRCVEQGTPHVTDNIGGTRKMTKDYFCRNILRDLREKANDLPIPQQKPSAPKHSSPPTATTTSAHKPTTPSKPKTVFFKTVPGENNPAKKPVVEKRAYNKILNWQDGCPKCEAKPSSYDAFKKHLSRGCGPSARVKCKDCGIEVAKSNTTHLNKCPNQK